LRLLFEVVRLARSSFQRNSMVADLRRSEVPIAFRL